MTISTAGLLSLAFLPAHVTQFELMWRMAMSGLGFGLFLSPNARVMVQSAPTVLELPVNAPPADYWNIARTLSLIGDTLVRLDAQDRPQPGLAVSWESDPGVHHWQLTLRRGVRFHDGSAATPAALAQILGALHPGWNVRASADSISIDSETAMPATSGTVDRSTGMNRQSATLNEP